MMHQIDGDHPSLPQAGLFCCVCGGLCVPWRLTEALVTYTDKAVPGGKVTVTALVCRNCEFGEFAEWPGKGT